MQTAARLWRYFLDKTGVANLLAFLLLGSALVCLVYGISAASRSLDAGRLLLVSFVGGLCGWLLASTKIKGWAAALVSFLTGALLILLSIGRLAQPFGRLVSAAQGWLAQAGALPVWNRQALAGLDTSLLSAAWSGLGFAGQSLALRTGAWLAGVFNGAPINDPPAALLVWSFIFWGLAAWAAWWVHRRRQPLVGLAPAGALLAISLAYSSAALYSLAGWIGAVVALQGLSEYQNRLDRWQRRKMDRAEVEAEWGFAVFFIVAALVSFSIAAPSLSIARLASRIQEMFAAQDQAGQNLAEALGVRRGEQGGNSPLEQARNPGLPNQHLLGSGAELSDQIVMWVSLSGYQPPRLPDLVSQLYPSPPAYYWRGATYDRYTGRGWSSIPVEYEKIPAGGSIAARLAGVEGGALRQVRQTIYRASGDNGLLYAAGEPLAVSQDYEAAWRANDDLFGVQAAGSSYKVDSRLSRPTEEQLRQAGRDYPAWVRRAYLPLPGETPQRVWNLALDLTAGQPTAYDQAKAIEAYLRQFPYTLDVPAPPVNRDLVDYFLFDLKRGYCDYYSSTMAVLARAAGLPARMVVGYSSGSYIPEEGRYVVTAADAHAWTEIYFPGYGWVEFEPTAGRPPVERPAFDEAQAGLAALPTPIPPLETVASAKNTGWGVWLLGVLGVSLTLFGVWVLAEGWRLRRLAPGQAILAIYRRLYLQGRRLFDRLPGGLTPDEFADRVASRLSRSKAAGMQGVSASLLEITRLYGESAYSPHQPGEQEKQLAVRSWLAVRGRLWRGRVMKMLGK